MCVHLTIPLEMPKVTSLLITIRRSTPLEVAEYECIVKRKKGQIGCLVSKYGGRSIFTKTRGQNRTTHKKNYNIKECVRACVYVKTELAKPISEIIEQYKSESVQVFFSYNYYYTGSGFQKPRKRSMVNKWKYETDGKTNLNYNLTFKIVTNKLSFSIPRAIFIRLSNYTTILIYSPILAAVLRKVIQETFAS
jgi:hypothetical protein